MNETMIRVENLRKTYKGGIEAVKGITFTVPKSQIFDFLGPNGAGKSTTINILNTLTRPSSGHVLINSLHIESEVKSIRKMIGTALQSTAIDPELTGKELLTLHAQLYGMGEKEAVARAGELLKMIDLEKDSGRKCREYSGGMKRRLDLAMTMVHRPEILFLDEPTVGLDPLGRIELWDEIKHLNKQYGTTIFLTTQYLDEADKVSDFVTIIKDGIIVAEGTPAQLKRSVVLESIVFTFSDIADVRTASNLVSTMADNTFEAENELTVFTPDSRNTLPKLLQTLSSSHLFPIGISVSAPTLEDVFFQVTKAQ